jgi:hypothetical protein
MNSDYITCRPTLKKATMPIFVAQDPEPATSPVLNIQICKTSVIKVLIN